MGPERDPIVRGILFSKHFVPTYYIVLAVLAISVSLKKWLFSKRISRTRSVTNEQSPERGLVSQCTNAALDSPGKDISRLESTPLLSQAAGDDLKDTWSTRVSCYIESWLVFQPRPIRALSAPINVLPSNNTSLSVALLFAVNLFYLFYRNVPPYSGLDVFAVRAGLCCVANIPVIYVLAAKNSYILLRTTGWSYESLNIFHRRLAEWTVLLACVHASCMLGVWYSSFIPNGYSWAYFFRIRLVILGLISLSSFVLLWATSVGYVRRKAYELFLAVHVLAQVVALVALFFHHPNTRWYTGSALLVWLADRIALRTLLLPQKFVATLQLALDQETVLVHVNIPVDHNCRAGNIRGGWSAGQHVFLSVPSLGLKYRYQRHPFTIASPAPSPATIAPEEWPLQLIIRGQSGFSQKFVEFAKHHQHVEVVIDGPYGSTGALDALQHAERRFLVAGGSGISVTYPLAWAVRNGPYTSIIDSRTTYRNGRKYIPEITLSSRPEDDGYCHLWIRRIEEHQSWISLLPADSTTKHDSELPETDDRHSSASQLISRSVSTSSASYGRPDIHTELSAWVRGGGLGNKSSQICVVVSGPDELSRDVRNSVSSLVREGWNIIVVVEKFNW